MNRVTWVVAAALAIIGSGVWAPRVSAQGFDGSGLRLQGEMRSGEEGVRPLVVVPFIGFGWEDRDLEVEPSGRRRGGGGGGGGFDGGGPPPAPFNGKGYGGGFGGGDGGSGNDSSSNRRRRGEQPQIDLTNFRGGGMLFYNQTLITGGLERSIDEDAPRNVPLELGRRYNAGLGQEFYLNRDLTVAPVVNYHEMRTEFGNDLTVGVRGVGFGGGVKYAPGFADYKLFPRWAIYGHGIYYPDPSEFGFGGRFEADDAFEAGVGVQHNINKKWFANVGVRWDGYSVKDRQTKFTQDTLTYALTIGTRLP